MQLGNESVSIRAYKAYQTGNYGLALRLYKKLGALISEDLVAANIELCRKFVSDSEIICASEERYATALIEANFLDAECLLYADIDLNTVDGSAIWMSSMASILALQKKVIVVSKNKIRRDAVIANILNKENVFFLTPDMIADECESIDMSSAVDLIRQLDYLMRNVKTVVVRGLEVARRLTETRQFTKRLYAYLTDLYSHSETGIIIKEAAASAVDQIVRQCSAVLTQTVEIENLLRTTTKFPFKSIELPPPVIEGRRVGFSISSEHDQVIRIGYAGKIAPDWGIYELIDWVKAARKKGFDIELTIIGDKISGKATAKENAEFRKEMNALLASVGAIRLGALPREEVVTAMSKMDFAWCWRPGYFENATLEISTKMVEGIVAGQRCIAYPSSINVNSLGESYRYYAKTIEDFLNLLAFKNDPVDEVLCDRVFAKHSLRKISDRFFDEIDSQPKNEKGGLLCIATHDPKFIYPYYSHLKVNGGNVIFDEWDWGSAKDEGRSRVCADNADIVLCEWGLANAVWYSKNLNSRAKLYVRIHAQEVRKKAAKFGRLMNHDRVDKFIFVSTRVRNEAINLFGWPIEKTVVIPNFILDDEYLLKEDEGQGDVSHGHIKIGMVGIIPEQKRLDRAVSLLESLLEKGYRAKLYIKGQRPEQLDWMLKGDRLRELDYYYGVYTKINSNNVLKDAVSFIPWGNDVAKFYDNIDFIVSCSESESFHYALADGVLAGCYPIVWPWEESRSIYSEDWIVNGIDEAVESVINFSRLDNFSKNRILRGNREFLVQRYGRDKIFKMLDMSLVSDNESK